MMRNLSMALINVITNDGMAQVFLAFIIVMAYVVCTAWFLPWKEHAGNKLDCGMSCCLLMVLVGSIAFMPTVGGIARTVIEVIMVGSVVGALLAFCLIASHLMCIMGGVAKLAQAADPGLKDDFFRITTAVSEYYRMDPEDAGQAVTDFLASLPEKDFTSIRWTVDLLASGLLGVANATMKGIKPKMSDSARRMSVGTGSQDLDAFASGSREPANDAAAGLEITPGDADNTGPNNAGPGTAWAEK